MSGAGAYPPWAAASHLASLHAHGVTCPASLPVRPGLVTEWRWVENPAFAERKPEHLIATCHDRSPFITVSCTCGFDMHMHETQIAGVPPNATIGSKCKGCGELLEFPPAWIPAAFEAMRELGWIK